MAKKRSTPAIDSVATKLQNLLEKPGTEQQVRKFLAPLTETQRSELAPMCLKWHRSIRRNQFVEDPPGTFRVNPLLAAAETALFAVASYTEISKAGSRALPNGETLIEILRQRRPSWAGKIAEMLLHSSYYWNRWWVVRELVRLKLCSKPDDPRYYTGLISGILPLGRRQEQGSVLKQLRDDPSLLKDEVWKLFEYEGEDENTLANVDRFHDTGWSAALKQLSVEGNLSRAKLLLASLNALQLGFNHYRARWFYQFFDSLEPTPQEYRRHATTIFALASSPTPNVAQWAFENVQRLVDERILTASTELCEGLAPLLTARSVATVKSVLKLYEQLVTQHPPTASEICRIAASALTHQKPDVQKAAFTFIVAHGSPDDAPLRQKIDQYVPAVAASLRSGIRKWSDSTTTPQTASTAPKSTRQNKPAKTSKRKPVNLPAANPAYLKLLRIDVLTASVNTPSSDSIEIPATVFDGTEFPRLDPARKITPITDADELLRVCAQVMEEDTRIDDGERAMAALARLGHAIPA
ncbi:MAG: hypothetical protein KDA85_20255, partial [Planctomycetaceae bacterium]|nr:hypothetical protein [Planctomycetaceae bacterium]